MLVGRIRRDLHEGGRNCLKYLKKWWNRTEGRGHKDFKNPQGQGVGALKRGVGWNPQMNYDNNCLEKLSSCIKRYVKIKLF